MQINDNEAKITIYCCNRGPQEGDSFDGGSKEVQFELSFCHILKAVCCLNIKCRREQKETGRHHERTNLAIT